MTERTTKIFREPLCTSAFVCRPWFQWQAVCLCVHSQRPWDKRDFVCFFVFFEQPWQSFRSRSVLKAKPRPSGLVEGSCRATARSFSAALWRFHCLSGTSGRCRFGRCGRWFSASAFCRVRSLDVFSGGAERPGICWWLLCWCLPYPLTDLCIAWLPGLLVKHKKINKIKSNQIIQFRLSFTHYCIVKCKS